MNSITIVFTLTAVASVFAVGQDVVGHRSGNLGIGELADNATRNTVAALNTEDVYNTVRNTSAIVDNEDANNDVLVRQPVAIIDAGATTYVARKPAAPVTNAERQSDAALSAEFNTNAARKLPVIGNMGAVRYSAGKPPADVDAGAITYAIRKSTAGITAGATSAAANSTVSAANSASNAIAAVASTNFVVNDKRAADSDAHALALQINLQNQQNQASNAQSVADQASAIRQRSIISSVAARANSEAIAQSATNVASRHRTHVISKTAIAAGLINAGSAIDTTINQASVDTQTASALAVTNAAAIKQIAAILVGANSVRAQIINQAALFKARFLGVGPFGLGLEGTAILDLGGFTGLGWQNAIN